MLVFSSLSVITRSALSLVLLGVTAILMDGCLDDEKPAQYEVAVEWDRKADYVYNYNTLAPSSPGRAVSIWAAYSLAGGGSGNCRAIFNSNFKVTTMSLDDLFWWDDASFDYVPTTRLYTMDVNIWQRAKANQLAQSVNQTFVSVKSLIAYGRSQQGTVNARSFYLLMADYGLPHEADPSWAFPYPPADYPLLAMTFGLTPITGCGFTEDLPGSIIFDGSITKFATEMKLNDEHVKNSLFDADVLRGFAVAHELNHQLGLIDVDDYDADCHDNDSSAPCECSMNDFEYSSLKDLTG